MSRCLYCMEEIDDGLHWERLFQSGDSPVFCHHCSQQLIRLGEKRCARCSRESEVPLCQDCYRWQQYYRKDPLERNVSIFTYNTFMQEVIAKWKYRGDYVIGHSFQSIFQQVFQEAFSKKKKKEIISVPIPLSQMRGSERAFNQAEMLARFLPVPMELALQRKNSEKQSKKSRKERLSMTNPFILSKPLNKSVVLVDDIYTTGRTLRHAAEILKENGSPKVYAMTLIR